MTTDIQRHSSLVLPFLLCCNEDCQGELKVKHFDNECLW